MEEEKENKFPSNSKSFGIVVYMDDIVYAKTYEENMTIHFPIPKEFFIFRFLKHLYDGNIGAKNNIECIVIAHEHGEVNGKCHQQIYIKFENKIRKLFKPGKLTIDGLNYLYMAQTSKSPAKLRNYCKKGNDFYEILPCKTIKEILRENALLDDLMDVDDPYDKLLNNGNLTDKQILTIFKNCPVTEYKKDFMSNGKKIYETYNNYIKQENDCPPFEWKFPNHMYNHIQENFGANDKVSLVYTKLYTWFKTYCEPEGYFRRKALFLFSLAGGVGKSYFARSLVPEISICNSPYYVYCRGSLDASEFIRKDKTAKLVILDDVNYITNDIEIWKALTVSEPTNIRTPYHNTPWKHSLPCIMLSNNIKTLKFWMEAEDLKSRCIFIGIDFYIGPPGTDLEENHIVDSYLTNDINNKLGIPIQGCFGCGGVKTKGKGACNTI